MFKVFVWGAKWLVRGIISDKVFDLGSDFLLGGREEHPNGPQKAEPEKIQMLVEEVKSKTKYLTDGKIDSGELADMVVSHPDLAIRLVKFIDSGSVDLVTADEKDGFWGTWNSALQWLGMKRPSVAVDQGMTAETVQAAVQQAFTDGNPQAAPKVRQVVNPGFIPPRSGTVSRPSQELNPYILGDRILIAVDGIAAGSESTRDVAMEALATFVRAVIDGTLPEGSVRVDLLNAGRRSL